MATIRFIYGLICFISFFGHWQFDSHLLTKKAASDKIITIAQSQIGVTETSRKGQEAIKQYLNYVNIKTDAAWCAAFVSWVYKEAGYQEPRTAWSPALFPKLKQTLNPQKGDILGIYFVKLERIAHCGLVEQTYHDWVVSIEGNTNVSGSRNGDGVYRKWRHKRGISKYARWLPKNVN